jgi:hypothetical protein
MLQLAKVFSLNSSTDSQTSTSVLVQKLVRPGLQEQADDGEDKSVQENEEHTYDWAQIQSLQWRIIPPLGSH